MASKVYVVKKKSGEMEKIRGLAKAKKAADEAGAEVYDGDKCVYKGNAPADDGNNGDGENGSNGGIVMDGGKGETAASGTGSDGAAAGETAADKREDPDTVAEENRITRYRLKALMNVREKPAMTARIICTQEEGAFVNVAGIENDWLRLADGSYILYGAGKFAELA